MNRNVIIGLVLAVLVLGFGYIESTGLARAKECVDTDGGVNPFVRGTIESGILGRFQFNDECLSETTLNEYYCKRWNAKSTKVECGFGCEEGVCRTPENCVLVANLKDGQTETYTVNDHEYEVELVSLSTSNSEFKINGELTGILNAGQSFTAQDGQTISLIGIWVFDEVDAARFCFEEKGEVVPDCSLVKCPGVYLDEELNECVCPPINITEPPVVDNSTGDFGNVTI